MTTPEAQRKTGGLVATLAFSGIAASLMQTLVTPLIAQLPMIFNTSSANTTWIITITLLMAGVAVPIAGRLGDLYGKRKMLLICIVPLVAGSVVCATAPSIVPMIIGRGLQGMGMGVLPLGIALLRDVVPKEKLSSSIALVSATMGVGGALGLPIAAAVAEFADWRVLFWGAAGIALLAGACIFVVVPHVPAAARGQRFDVPGAVGLGIGVAALLLGISKGSTWGWTSGLTLGLLAGAAVVLLVWGWWETRTRDPLVDLRTAARPRVLMTNIASLFVGFAMYASMLVVPQLLQFPAATGYGLGQSILQAGLWMAPAGVMMMIVSPIGGKLTDRFGPKLTLILGAAVIAAGYAVAQPLMGTAWGLMIVCMVINTGVGFAYGAMPTLIMGSVPRTETAAANGFNTLVRSLGTTVGATVVGAILAENVTDFGGVSLASEHGFRLALIVGGSLAVVAAVIAAPIPTLRPSKDAGVEPSVGTGAAANPELVATGR
jgi:MFS family permease